MSAPHVPFNTQNGQEPHFQATSPYPSESGSAPSHVPNGRAAGEHTVVQEGDYGMAGPSSVAANGYPSTTYAPSHNEQIIAHIHRTGFNMGEYSDTILHAGQHRYMLHALILSRSPYLAHLISTSPKSGGVHTIYVPLESIPECSDQGFAIALGYLYSSAALSSLSPSNARAVLAAGCLLGGMEDLCEYAYQACRDSITVNTINEWIDFVDGLPSSPDGTVSPSEVQRPTVLGPYAAQLRSDVFDFLVVTLPNMLDVGSASSNGRETLLRVFSRLPFDLFKSAIESPMFQIGSIKSEQDRFQFAKAAIELRKQTRGGSVEETVVLAFGGGHGSAVHVTRKTKKRALFKVG